MSDEGKHPVKPANQRGAARLAAVQALYQMDIAGSGVLEVVAHPSALGSHDFGDAYLGSGESLQALLDQRLAGVPRVGYASLREARQSTLDTASNR